MLSFIARHKFLSAGTILLLGIVAAVALLVFYDEAPPDDRDFKPQARTTVAPEDNAITVLRRLPERIYLQWDDFPELHERISYKEWDKFLQGEQKAPEIRTRILEKNGKVIQILHEASTKPYLQHALRSLTGDDTATESPGITFINSVRLMQIWYRDDNQHFFKEATAEALGILYMVRKYTASTEQGIPILLAGLAAENLLIRSIGEATATARSAEFCIKTAHALSLHQYDPQLVFPELLRNDYAFLDAVIKANPKRNNTLRARYAYKPNTTKRRLLEVMREAIDCSDKGDSRIHGERTIQAYQEYANTYNPTPLTKWMLNNGGSAIYSSIASKIPMAYHTLLCRQTQTNLVRTNFAMRAYWLDHGALPDSLEALIPEYLPSVPLDLFSRKPLQYNKDKYLIYSVGKDLLDDDGSFAFEEDTHPDGPRPFVKLDWAKQD